MYLCFVWMKFSIHRKTKNFYTQHFSFEHFQCDMNKIRSTTIHASRLQAIINTAAVNIHVTSARNTIQSKCEKVFFLRSFEFTSSMWHKCHFQTLIYQPNHRSLYRKDWPKHRIYLILFFFILHLISTVFF